MVKSAYSFQTKKEKVENHIIVVWVDNESGVLARVAGLFSRRGFNISNLSVGRSESEGLSRMTFVVEGDERVVEQVTKQLYKLIDVIRVSDLSEDSIIVRELAFIKVKSDENNLRLDRWFKRHFPMVSHAFLEKLLIKVLIILKH